MIVLFAQFEANDHKVCWDVYHLATEQCLVPCLPQLSQKDVLHMLGPALVGFVWGLDSPAFSVSAISLGFAVTMLQLQVSRSHDVKLRMLLQP